jgi:3-methyladenine DNA glycosylase AlkD
MLESVSAVKNEEFYVNMAVAWYFSMALAKHYEAALPYIKNRRLSDWTHNKTIQKACESRQISEERKAYLKTLKIPKKR